MSKVYYTLTQSSVQAPKIEIRDAADDSPGGDWAGPFVLPSLAEAKSDAKRAWDNAENSNGVFAAKETDKLVEALEFE